MKKLSTMWTSNVEIEACLDSRTLELKNWGFYSGVKLHFTCTFFHESRIVTIFASINFYEFAKISTPEN